MSKERTPARGNTFTLSLILGLLLIPVSAVAALALVDRTETDDDVLPTASAEPLSALTTVVAASAAAEPTAGAALAIACGDEGWALVEKEVDGSINALEQAALDALRGICESAGLPLAGPPAPAPVVQTVRVTTPAPAASSRAEPAPVDASGSVEPTLPADTAADLDDSTENGADDEDDAAVPDGDQADDHDEDDEEDHEDEEDDDHHEDEEDEEDEER